MVVENMRRIGARASIILLLAATTLSAHAIPSIGGQRYVPSPLELASEALTHGDLAKAQAAFLALNAANPKAPEPYLGLAEIAIRKNDPHAAEAYLTRGIQASPQTPGLHVARARLYALQNRVPIAIADFQSAIALAPQKSFARLELANYFTQRLGQPQKALPLYQQALAIEPGNAAARYGLGVDLALLKRYGDAVATFTEARRLAPNDPMPSVGLAQVLISQRNFKGALDAINAALVAKPDLTDAHLMRADILLGMQSPRQAAADYELVLKTAPNFVPALLGLAMAEQADARADAAEATYRTLLAKDVKQPVALNNLAMILAGRSDRLAEASDLAGRAVALAPKVAAFHDTLGYVALQRRVYQQAVSEFTLALKLQPSAETFAHLGQAQAAMGKKDDAEKSFRAALKLTPQYAPAQKGLAAIANAGRH